jgi:hypothetical protein
MPVPVVWHFALVLVFQVEGVHIEGIHYFAEIIEHFSWFAVKIEN